MQSMICYDLQTYTEWDDKIPTVKTRYILYDFDGLAYKSEFYDSICIADNQAKISVKFCHYLKNLSR